MNRIGNMCTARDAMTGGAEEDCRVLVRNDEMRREFIEKFPAVAFETSPDRRTCRIWGDVRNIIGTGGPAALPGEPGWEALIHPEDRARYHEETVTLWTRPGGKLEREYRLVCADGSLRWVNEQAWCSTNEGLPVIRGFVRDIGERVESLSGKGLGVFDLLRTERALRESEARYRAVVEAQTDLIFRCLPDGTLTFVNDFFRIRLGFWRDIPGAGRTVRDLFDTDSGAMERAFASIGPDRATVTLELLLSGALPGSYWIQWTISAITDSEGHRIEYQAVGRDISVLKRTEERLRASLAEKEALLGEVHHRVKNNLQIISSILDMSGMSTPDEHAAAVIDDARSRIHTIALIHSQLMRSDRVDRIDMRQYIADLTGHLMTMRDDLRDRVRLVIEVRDVYLDMDRAVPFALALHEIIANSLKHAFPGGRAGTIRIRVEGGDDGMVFANISDDGIGLAEGADQDRAGKFGMMLIQLIIREQLAGTLKIDGAHGAEYRIQFSPEASEDKNAQNHGG